MQTFDTPANFRMSLEARLSNLAKKSGQDPQRLRRKVAFDRFLARIFLMSKNQGSFLLKGGYAMELRFKHARATKDIDLTFLKNNTPPEDFYLNQNVQIVELLREATSEDIGDYFEFHIGEATNNLENAPYGGARYKVESIVDSRLFVRFQLDVGSDILSHEPELMTGGDWLNFAGIKQPVFEMIPAEQQFAEKIHAYSLPREHQNSRSRDLVDLLLLVNNWDLDCELCFNALKRVFKSRSSHKLPNFLLPPPNNWTVPFERMAEECGLNPDISVAFQKVKLAFERIVR